MTRLTIAVLLIFLPSIAVANQAEKWMRMLDHPEYPSQQLKSANLLDRYSKYDFSSLFLPRTPFLGYIGSNYRRLNIYFTSISRNPTDEAAYQVSGISLVGNNKCKFQGSIKIEQVREYRNLHYGLDDTYKDAGIKSEGELIGRYQFNEMKSQAHSGIFKGILTLYWVVDRNGIIHSDHIEYYSDGYNNNQYVGTWTEFGGRISLVANWGEERIPFSSSLDVGAGEFGVDEKYRKEGWDKLYLP